MDILIWKNDQQHGPYSESQIRDFLKTGKFSPQDLAWVDGQSGWKPLSDILPISSPPPPPSSPKQTTDEPSEAFADEPSASGPAKTFSESMMEKATAAVRLTQKQAYRKKLEMVDLRQADYQTGKKAYENNISSDLHAELFQQIADFQNQIDTIGNAPQAATTSLTEKAQAAANSASRMAKIEALSLKKNGLLTDLGARLRENSSPDPTLSAEIATANKTAEMIRSLDSEIKALSSHTFTWARRPLLIIIIIVTLAAASMGYGWMKNTYARWKTQREIEQVEQRVKAEQTRIAAQVTEMTRKAVEDRKKEDEARKIRLAQEELARKKQEIDREQAARVRQEKLEEDQRQQVEKQRQRELEIAESQNQKKLQEAERAKRDEVTKKQEQEQRAKFAAERFSLISISPRAALSPTLKRLNATVEMRGKDSENIQSLLQQGDYLKLISYLRDQPYTEYPPVTEIETALRKLARDDFSILLRTSLSVSYETQLFLVSFPDSEYRIVNSSNSWERHPDGIGYLHKWSPSDGPVIILLGNYQTIQNPIYSFNESARKQSEALKQKRDLGEIDEDSYRARLGEVRKTTYDAILKWALTR